MAEELDRAKTPPATASHTLPAQASTFPTGIALLAIAASIFFGRVTVRWMTISPAGMRAATVAGIGGTLLALFAFTKTLFESVRRDAVTTWIAAAGRVVLALPLFVLVASALRGEPAARVQWAALLATASTIFLSTLSALFLSRRLVLARVAIVTLLVGQCIELGWPVAHVAFEPGSAWPRAFDRVGWLSEVVSLIGAGCALAWSIRASVRALGTTKLGLYALFPAVLCAFLSVFVATVDRRFGVAIARHAFDVRFDLLIALRDPLFVTRADLVGYLLIAQMVFAAGMISFAGATVDRGASMRRALGWLAVVVAGFGSVRRPMDPMRMVLVSLAFVMLERAMIDEANERRG